MTYIIEDSTNTNMIKIYSKLSGNLSLSCTKWDKELNPYPSAISINNNTQELLDVHKMRFSSFCYNDINKYMSHIPDDNYIITLGYDMGDFQAPSVTGKVKGHIYSNASLCSKLNKISYSVLDELAGEIGITTDKRSLIYHNNNNQLHGIKYQKNRTVWYYSLNVSDTNITLLKNKNDANVTAYGEENYHNAINVMVYGKLEDMIKLLYHASSFENDDEINTYALVRKDVAMKINSRNIYYKHKYGVKFEHIYEFE